MYLLDISVLAAMHVSVSAQNEIQDVILLCITFVISNESYSFIFFTDLKTENVGNQWKDKKCRQDSLVERILYLKQVGNKIWGNIYSSIFML